MLLRSGLCLGTGSRTWVDGALGTDIKHKIIQLFMRLLQSSLALTERFPLTAVGFELGPRVLPHIAEG